MKKIRKKHCLFIHLIPQKNSPIKMLKTVAKYHIKKYHVKKNKKSSYFIFSDNKILA